jgi:hypothetical protein
MATDETSDEGLVGPDLPRAGKYWVARLEVVPSSREHGHTLKAYEEKISAQLQEAKAKIDMSRGPRHQGGDS